MTTKTLYRVLRGAYATELCPVTGREQPVPRHIVVETYDRDYAHRAAVLNSPARIELDTSGISEFTGETLPDHRAT